MRILNAILFVVSLDVTHTLTFENSDCDSWGRWTPLPETFVCEAVCETGVAKRHRSRDCLVTKLESKSGCVFTEVEEQSKECSVKTKCPAWTSWTRWTPTGACSVLCGVGRQKFKRTRECVGGAKCRGRSSSSKRRQCTEDTAMCLEYNCKKGVYKVITEIPTENKQYALCNNGSILINKCPSRSRLKRVIRILQWRLYFRYRNSSRTRMRLLKEILKAC